MRFMPFVKGKKGFQMAGGGVSDSGGGGGSYTLPPATSSVLGGVKIGTGVDVTSDGTISVRGSMHTYSPTERHVAWYQEVVDGVLKQKPVYETTFDAGSGVDVSYESWTSFKSVTFVPDRIPYAMGFNVNKQCFPIMAKFEFGEIKLQTPTNNSRSYVRFLVLRYTKEADEWVTV